MSSEEQQIHVAKDYRHFVYEGLAFATRRGEELSHEFMRLEIQVAAVLFAFSGVFIGLFSGSPSVWIRGTFAAALFCLVASIVCGLFHMKRKEKSWDDTTKEWQLKFNKWQDAIGRNGSITEARAYAAGISKGTMAVRSVPLWSWMLQSVFLGIATVLLLVLVVVFLFI